MNIVERKKSIVKLINESNNDKMLELVYRFVKRLLR